jgi:signal transduction histidine kinase
MLKGTASSCGIAGELDEITALIVQAIKDTRSLTYDLSSPILEELGLEVAVKRLVERMREKDGIRIDFYHDTQHKPLDYSGRFVLYRTARELLVNIGKHAQAQNARVSIRRVGEKIRIDVEDDGVGFDASEFNSNGKNIKGLGLFTIRARLSYLGGHLDLASNPGKGTRATLVLPLKSDDKEKKVT